MNKLVCVLGLTATLAAPAAFAEPEGTPQVRWPLLKQDWNHTFHYVDLDAGAAVLDWACSDVAYDTHRGNDMTIRDFLEMDEGRFVVAAAEGTVSWVEDGFYDRTPSQRRPPELLGHLPPTGTHSLLLPPRTCPSGRAGHTCSRVGPGPVVAGNSSNPHVHIRAVIPRQRSRALRRVLPRRPSLWKWVQLRRLGEPWLRRASGVARLAPCMVLTQPPPT